MRFPHIPLLAAGLTLAALLGCQTPSKKAEMGPQDSSDLTWTQAQARKARLSDIHYALSIRLDETQETFSGANRIDFTLTDAKEPLRVDFFEGTVTSLRLNDQPLDPTTAKKPYWIELPAAALRPGANTLQVEFSHEYSHQGQGLHRFNDPATHETFLYTQFETFDANRFMPCFDQPDLRATLDLEVTAPRDWTVVSTTRETETKILAPDRRFWKFATTPKIATYLFSLHAGPFKVWTDQFDGLPLRLMARPSLAPYVNPAKWFQITKQGLRFYNSYYQFAYPFKKYDQLLVPEFNAGAMENVGAVTFSEFYISRSTMARAQWRSLSSTILHEMAHMWFGDLVTMKWWNDLWLNESFATYMSALAMSQATEYKEAWQSFYSGEKNWAYWQDSLATTHPIEAPVKTVKEAFANFDGITYGKGASILKQLSAYIGTPNFQKGVQAYLKEHAYGNAELKDFIGALQAETGKDLNLWAERWLRQSGTDKLAARWSCEGDRLKKIELTMSPVPNTRFRPQTFTMSLHKRQGTSLVSVAAIPVDLETPEKTLTGDWSCPDLIYPNADDAGYFAVQFDPRTLQTLKEHLSDLPAPLLRTMIWADLWRMVRFQEMPLKDYVAIVDRHFGPEKDELLLRDIVATISGRRGEEGTVLYFWPTDSQASRDSKNQFVSRIETEYRRRFERSPGGSDLQKFWFDSYVHVAQTAAALDDLQARLSKPAIAAKFPWDLDRQWQVVRRLERFARPGAEAWLTKMKQKDPSERGHKEALSAEAAKPQHEVKRKWVDLVREPRPKISLADVHAALGSLFPVEQTPLAKAFKNDFYDYLQKNGNSENTLYVQSVAGTLAPLYCESASAQELRTFLKGTRLSPSVHKELLTGLEEDERCQKIRAGSGL